MQSLQFQCLCYSATCYYCHLWKVVKFHVCTCNSILSKFKDSIGRLKRRPSKNGTVTLETKTAHMKTESVLGWILLGLFWLFLFQFRNNRIHGNSILQRMLLLKMEYPWQRWPENYYYVCCHVGFPAKNLPPECVFCLFWVNCIRLILFILLSGAEWTEWYSNHSENEISPKRTQIPSIPSIPIPE